MTQTMAVSSNAQEVNGTFVIRLNWDRVSGQWLILLKPVDGQEARLFGTMEAALVYLETVIQQEGTRAYSWLHNSLPIRRSPNQ